MFPRLQKGLSRAQKRGRTAANLLNTLYTQVIHTPWTKNLAQLTIVGRSVSFLHLQTSEIDSSNFLMNIP